MSNAPFLSEIGRQATAWPAYRLDCISFVRNPVLVQEPKTDMENLRTDSIPNPAVRRLSLYLRQLEVFHRMERRTISSRQLGEALNLTDAQVRKDLAYFGQFGHPGIGYKVEDLIAHVRKILGTDRTWNVLLIGAGNLGRALSAYKGFEKKGFKLLAVFDADPALAGRRYGPFVIQPMSELSGTIQRLNIRMGIITVPADFAQKVADELVAAGIRGILNFAPVSLNVPPTVSLAAVDLAVQLEQLSFAVNVALPAEKCSSPHIAQPAPRV